MHAKNRSGANRRRRETEPGESNRRNPPDILPIGVLLHDVARLRRQVFDAEMQPEGLTRSQCWVLAYLARHEGRMMQSEVAAALDVGKVALGGLVDRLEAGGLVRRESCPEDRRVRYVVLTDRGREAAESIERVRPVVDDVMMRGLSATKRREVAEALRLMRRNLLKVRRARQSESTREQ